MNDWYGEKQKTVLATTWGRRQSEGTHKGEIYGDTGRITYEPRGVTCSHSPGGSGNGGGCSHGGCAQRPPLSDPRRQMDPLGVGGGAGAYFAPPEYDRLLLNLN